ncbi:hypothetical protein CEXT_616321 [Caerostris extrusa]|uniref:Uncharacterized protein n=1 Tax=Caerostris extrusa TaxID=172846 RepID=A0AAV4W603_CAEEX|nr:hypothetical protein CEXT_616321 [Caerostris extrusa]
MKEHCSLLPGEPFRNRRDKFHTGINKTTHTTSPLFLNTPPAIMGYRTASFFFSVVAVHYVRFTEPRPRLHGNGEVFSLQPKWKNRRDKYHPGINQTAQTTIYSLNPPPATMGYPTASFSFSVVTVHYVRFTEPRPRLRGNGEVFPLQLKWK